ncbi:MAG: hypothetical protein GY953_09705, partial [bacterium]|nr:hypothetical protein [bacterium]
MAKVRLEFDRSNPPVRDRVALVNAKLKSAAGDIGLRISPRAKGLIRDFEQVSYKEGSGVIDKDRDTQRTHLSDALGYLVWHQFGPRRSSGEQRRSLRL